MSKGRNLRSLRSGFIDTPRATRDSAAITSLQAQFGMSHVCAIDVSYLQMLNTESLNELVRRAQAGDVRAFGQLVEATETAVYGVVWNILRDGSTEDAAQQ